MSPPQEPQEKIELVECPVCHRISMPQGNYVCSTACYKADRSVVRKAREEEVVAITKAEPVEGQMTINLAVKILQAVIIGVVMCVLIYKLWDVVPFHLRKVIMKWYQRGTADGKVTMIKEGEPLFFSKKEEQKKEG